MVVLLISISVGSAMALVLHQDDTKVTGNFEVQNPAGSSITVQNSGAFNVIKLNDIDDGQIYQFRLVGDGSRLDIVDITHNRVNIAMISSNGNVGIGTISPQEALDVNGNIRLNGNIVSSSDICIGTCP